MQWAFQRQFLYACSVLLVLLLLGVGGWYLFVYAPPTCSDGTQNQDEEGVDCGGVCQLLCKGPLVSALWARAVPVAPGVYHAVALVRNPDSAAETKNLPYTFSLFDAENVLVAERKGTMFLVPGESAPLFEANIQTGERIPVRTFVSFGQGTWTKGERMENPLRVISRDLNSASLRLAASIENQTPLPVENTVITALLYDAAGTLVNASQTIVPVISSRERRDIVFTWQEPFSAPIVRIDIIPRLR